MTRSLPGCLLAFLGASSLLGCAGDGGQTGEETGGACRETKTALELDGATPLGFSARTLLTAAASAEDVAGLWLPISGLPYGPETGASSLSLTLGAVRSASFVHSEVNTSGTEQTLVGCADRVEVTVEASARTDGGALDEQFGAVLTSNLEGDVLLDQLFDPTALMGTFAFDAQALGAKRFERLTLHAHWLPGSFAAGLAAGLEESSGSGSNSAVSLSNTPVACFSDPESGTPQDCSH